MDGRHLRGQVLVKASSDGGGGVKMKTFPLEGLLCPGCDAFL